MKAKDLKKFLETVPDDALIVVSDFDHSYREVHSPEVTKAETGMRGYLGEYYPDCNIDPKNVVEVVVFS